MQKARLGIVGASGRMGSIVGALARGHYADRLVVSALISRGDADFDALAETDIAIDFSLPPGTAALVDWLERSDAGPQTVVCGTTGMDDALTGRLYALADARRILHATNFSAGVGAMRALLESAAPMLHRMGYTPVLTETHHRHKKDAPSGTALTLRRSLQPFAPADVATHSIRAGEIVGTHELSFYGDHDQLTVAHQALDRGVFARGALDAALWLHGRSAPAGGYDMQSYIRERFIEP